MQQRLTENCNREGFSKPLQLRSLCALWPALVTAPALPRMSRREAGPDVMNVSGREGAVVTEAVTLRGLLGVPAEPRGVVVFAHGSGSGRLSSRNNAVARSLQDAISATLLVDLFTEEEERADAATAHLRFDIDLLAKRLVAGMRWLIDVPDMTSLNVGYFGASTGAAAALTAAATEPDRVRAVVSRGGRPDLAGDHLTT